MENEMVSTPQTQNATIEEAAAFLKVSRRTVQLYQERGLLKPVYMGKFRRYPWSAIKRIEKTGFKRASV